MSDFLKKLMIIRTPKIGPVRYAELIRKFGSVDAVVDFLNPDSEFRDSVLREMDKAQKMNIHYLSDDSPFYPFALRNIKNHPPIITVRGNLEALAKPAVSIVGTRHATASGMKFVADVADGFAERGFSVVSGMAVGTDTAAHRGALRACGNSNTIAVLAGGVDYIWPLENESLYWEIVERGAIISEMPVGFVPVATNFVQRNRWVAGMAERLVLGEADMKSGSMTTARFAIDYGREIWAIPSHPLDLRSVGPNSLIRSGNAKLCMGPDDFFKKEKNSSEMKKNRIKNESEFNLIDRIGNIPVSESVLAELVKKQVSEIKAPPTPSSTYLESYGPW